MEQPKYRNLSIKCDNVKQLKTTLYKDEESLQSKDKVSLSRIVLELLFPPNDDLAFFSDERSPLRPRRPFVTHLTPSSSPWPGSSTNRSAETAS